MVYVVFLCDVCWPLFHTVWLWFSSVYNYGRHFQAMVTCNTWQFTVKAPDVQRGYFPVAIHIRSFYVLCIVCLASFCCIYFQRFGFASLDLPSASRSHIHRIVLTRQVTCRVYSLLDKVITTLVIRPLNDHTYCTRSAYTHLGLWRKLYNCSLHHFTTSQCILKCVDWHLVGCNLKVGLFDPRFGVSGRGLAHLIACPLVSISSPLAHMVSFVPFLG